MMVRSVLANALTDARVRSVVDDPVLAGEHQQEGLVHAPCVKGEAGYR